MWTELKREIQELLLKNSIVHEYPPLEEAIHYTKKEQWEAREDQEVCWCDPDVTNYGEMGAGLHIRHRQVVWQ